MMTIQEAVDHLIDQNRLVWAENTQRTYRNVPGRACVYLVRVEGLQFVDSPTLLGQDLAIAMQNAVYLVEVANRAL
jgi:hypothetical protein